MATFAVTDTLRRKQYSGNGSAGPFAFSFQINATSDIKVLVDATTKSISTHYTVSIASNGTGTVSFTTDNYPTSSQKITLIGKLPYSRASVYTSGGALTAASLEADLDTIAMMQQQLDEKTQRGIKLAESTTRDLATTGELSFPYDATTSNNASKLIAYASNGTSLETVTGRVNSITASNVAAGGNSTAAFTASTGALALGLVIGNTGSQGNVGNTGASTKWTTGNSFPSSSLANGDLHLFTSVVSSGLSWFDTNGSSSLSAAAKGDVAQYQSSGTKWVKQTNTIGSTGSQGSVGPAGSAGINLTWETATADSDQGVGKIWGNHGTFASISGLYIDDVDANSVNIEAWIQALDDSTNTALRGTIYFEEAGTNSNFGVFSVTGACVDKTGYWFVPVTHVASAVASLADGDTVGAVFTRTGNIGTDGADGNGTFNNFVLTADSGTNQTVTTTNTVDIAGGNSITTVVGATDTVTINADDGTASAKGAVIVAGTTPASVSYSSGTATISVADSTASAKGIAIVAGTSPVSVGYSSGTATVAVADASTSAKGIATFASADFSVSSGAVTLEAAVPKTDEVNVYTKPQRNAFLVDNDLSFDQAANSNFKATPSGNGAITFTNQADGQSGYVLLINSGGHTLSLHANTKGSASAAATLSAAGTFLISYISDGSNSYITNSVVYA